MNVPYSLPSRPEWLDAYLDHPQPGNIYGDAAWEICQYVVALETYLSRTNTVKPQPAVKEDTNER